jgi:hypothetical protein
MHFTLSLVAAYIAMGLLRDQCLADCSGSAPDIPDETQLRPVSGMVVLVRLYQE